MVHRDTTHDGEAVVAYARALWAASSVPISDSTMRRTAAIVADTAGVASLASSRPELRAFTIGAQPGPSSTVLAELTSAAPDVAAAVNGTAAVWNELDEGLRGAGHPGAHVVPAAIAVAETEGAAFSAALLGILRGYQVQADLAEAYEIRDEVHPHGALGAPAAAVAASSVLGLTPDAAVMAIAIASNLAPAGSWSACTEGSTVRNVLAGQGAQIGVRAAYLARAGATAPRDSIDLALGVVRGRPRATGLRFTATDHRAWAIERGYLKRWSACAWTHSALDVVERIIAGSGRPAPDDIIDVEVRVPEVGLRVSGLHLAPPLAVRFSIPALVATLLVHGALLPSVDDLSHDRKVGALAERVRVVRGDDLEALWPTNMAAIVRIRLRDGRVLEDRVDDPVGPSSTDDYVEGVRRKFEDSGLSTDRLDALVGPSFRSADAVRGVFASHEVTRTPTSRKGVRT